MNSLLDFFKNYNDIWGHVMGDYCLQTITSRLKALDYDSYFIGRYGGEEFLIVLNTCSDKIFNTFERLRLTIAETQFKVEHLNLNITMSFGLAVLLPTVKKRDAVSLIASADKALYKAKDSGRDQTVYISATDATAQQKNQSPHD